MTADPAGARDILVAARPDSDPAGILSEITVMAKYEHTAATEGKMYGWVADADILQTISSLEKYSAMKAGLKPADIYTADYLPAQ